MCDGEGGGAGNSSGGGGVICIGNFSNNETHCQFGMFCLASTCVFFCLFVLVTLVVVVISLVL